MGPSSASSALGITLRFLPAHSAAVVGAGLGIDLLLKHVNPAYCFSFGHPYDEDVFKAGGYAGPETADPSIAPLPALSLKPRTRPIGWDAWKVLSSSRNICITLIRNEGVSTLLVLNAYFAQLYEEEERAERECREPLWPAFPKAAMAAAARRGAINSCIDFTVQCVRAVLDTTAVARLSPSLSQKLVLDLRAQAPVLAMLAWPRRALRTLCTALRSEATLFAADALVASGVECLGAVRWYKGTPGRRARRLARRCALHGLRGLATLCAVALGNALGSTVPVVRAFVTFLAAQAASMATNMFMAALLERLTPEEDDGSSASSGGGGAAWGVRPRAAARASISGPHPTDDDVSGERQLGAAAEGAAQALGGMLARLGVQAAATASTGSGMGSADDASPAAPPVILSGEDSTMDAAAEPPVPAVTERRPPHLTTLQSRAGPRLPERPREQARRGRGGTATPAGTPPQGPPTPQFRETRPAEPERDDVAVTPVEEDEDTAALAADMAAAAVRGALASNEGVDE